MGVYIKGFDFPKACWFCDFCRAYNEPNHGYFCCALNADLDKTTEIIQTQRDKHCPLVEVKPHGRLIDADALLAEFEVDESSCDAHGQDFTFSFIRGEAYCTEWYYPQQRLMDAPTIIESEGEDGRTCRLVTP